MPTEQEFEASFAATKACGTSAQRLDLVKQLYPTEAQKQEFYQWASRQKGPRPAATTPVPELLTLISKTNFNVESEREALKSAVKGTPFILGTRDGNKYRIVPRTDALVIEGGADKTKTADALDHAFLWIDTTSPSISTASSSKIDKSSIGTDLSDQLQTLNLQAPTTGFPCFQLGQVEHFLGTSSSSSTESWGYIGFSAVVRVASSGKAEGIYLVWDFYWEDPHEDNFARTRRVEEFWGVFPGMKEQFSCAKIAGKDEIRKLGDSFVLEISEVCKGMVKIGEARMAEDGSIAKVDIALEEKR